MKIAFSLKSYLLIVGYLCTCIFITFSNHHADLEFYLNDSGESLRTGLMKYAVLPFSYLTQNLNAMSILWGSILVLVAIKLQNYLSVTSCYLIIILGPFLLIPSKESLVFLCCLISTALIINRHVYIALLLIAILFIVRPFYAPIFLILLWIYISKKPIKLITISFISVIFTLIFLDEKVIELINGYAIGYYDSAINAGTTDWNFIEYVKDEKNVTTLLTVVLYRCIFPIWMLILGDSGKIYFVWYLIIEIISLITLYSFLKMHNNNNLKLNTILLFLIAVVPVCSLLVTNAGSAVRYFCLLPLILQLIKFNLNIKNKF